MFEELKACGFEERQLSCNKPTNCCFWEPKKSGSYFHRSLALGESEFTFDFRAYLISSSHYRVK